MIYDFLTIPNMPIIMGGRGGGLEAHWQEIVFKTHDWREGDGVAQSYCDKPLCENPVIWD